MCAELALELDDVRLSFGGVHALDGLTLSARRGEITAVLGPNGAGKTTMIRCCTDIYAPASGKVQVCGTSPREACAHGQVGVMPQSAGAWSGIRPVELIRYLAGLAAHPLPVAELCAELGIHDFAKTPYRRLSGGQQQAVNLAGAIVGRPALVFLDEPTAGMDPHARRAVWALLRRLRAAGMSILLTTHAMDEAADLADYLWIVDHGQVRIHGTLADLTADGRSLEDVFLSATESPMGR